MCSQLFVCINQNSIKPSLINYLVNKYVENYGIEAARNEIVRVISCSSTNYHLNLFHLKEVFLETANMLIILKTLLRYLNRYSIINLRKALNTPFNFVDYHFLFYFHNIVSPSIENDSNYRDCYLFLLISVI